RLRGATAGWVWVCAAGGVGRVEQEITRSPVPGIRHRLHVDSYRWVVEREFALYAIGVQVLPLPEVLEAVSVDDLPVLQLELDQVNVYRMGIFRQVLEVPCLGGADPGKFSDSLIEMPSVNEHRHRAANGFLLVQGEDLRVADVRGLNERGNGDQRGRQGFRMHGLRVLHRELHDHTRVCINRIAARERRIGGVRHDDLGSGRQVGEIDQDVHALTDGHED